MYRRCGLALIVIVASWSTGCGARTEYGLTQLAVRHKSWDSLAVDVAFGKRTAIGGQQSVEPLHIAVFAYSERYDTLFEGPTTEFTISDEALGDREGIVVEVCGRLSGGLICGQTATRASPKRLSLRENITYPTDDLFDTGRYDLDLIVDRREFDDDTWKRIDYRGPFLGYIEVYVDASSDGRIRIPLDDTTGRFSLRRHEAYDDFRFNLDSELMDRNEADVAFEVYGGLGEYSELLATSLKTVSTVTDGERLVNVHGFVRQVAHRLVSDLSSIFGGRRSTAYLDAWHYEQAERQYIVSLEVAWRGSFFDRQTYRIEGELIVDEDGRNARFSMLGGNRAGIARWDRRMPGPEVELGPLSVENPPRRYRPGRGVD